MSEAIFVGDLTKVYHGKIVVDHLDLSVKNGTVFGLLGANGVGKSTVRFSSALAYSFRNAIITKRSRFPSFVRKPQAFTAVPPIGASSVSSSASGIRQIQR